MDQPYEVIKGVFVIGSSQISNPGDCMVYLIDCGRELVLIDAGVSDDISQLERNIRDLGYRPHHITTLFITHAHIDHIGGALSFRREYGCIIVAHELDSQPLEKGDPELTGASLYGIDLEPFPVNCKLSGSEGEIGVGNRKFTWIHTPGHTPGSISILLETKQGNILFAQDVHGPFFPQWGADIFQWGKSMKKLLSRDFDILAEGHFGIYRPRKKARKYIEDYLAQYGQK